MVYISSFKEEPSIGTALMPLPFLSGCLFNAELTFAAVPCRNSNSQSCRTHGYDVPTPGKAYPTFLKGTVAPDFCCLFGLYLKVRSELGASSGFMFLLQSNKANFWAACLRDFL